MDEGNDRIQLWKVLLLVLQPGVLGQMVPEVHYEDPQCAVKGSTVNVPCTFRPIDKVVRVRWCLNHEICHGTTPSVYDSRSPGLHPRYRYLGDWTGNCSLQIRDLELEDNNNIFRFRMETQDGRGHFTGRQGVKVTVDGTARMRISSSRVGDNIVLSCSSDCTYHDLSFTWSKDHLTTLEETGPSLTLTEADHGNYSCGLKDKIWTRSDPFTLQLNTAGNLLPLVLGVVAAVLLSAGAVPLVLLAIRRTRLATGTPDEGRTKEKDPEVLYSSVTTVSRPKDQKQCRTVGGASEEVTYAKVHFKPSSAAADSVIYSSVAQR